MCTYFWREATRFDGICKCLIKRADLVFYGKLFVSLCVCIVGQFVLRYFYIYIHTYNQKKSSHGRISSSYHSLYRISSLLLVPHSIKFIFFSRIFRSIPYSSSIEIKIWNHFGFSGVEVGLMLCGKRKKKIIFKWFEWQMNWESMSQTTNNLEIMFFMLQLTINSTVQNQRMKFHN